MVGKYQLKTDRQLKFDEDLLRLAKERIERGESERSVPQSLGVNECSLRKRLKAGTIPTSLGRFTLVFMEQMDLELANHIQDLDNRFYGLQMRDVMSLAFQYAELNGIAHRFNKEKKTAGRHWAKDFALQLGFYEKTKTGPHRVFNMDESLKNKGRSADLMEVKLKNIRSKDIEEDATCPGCNEN